MFREFIYDDLACEIEDFLFPRDEVLRTCFPVLCAYTWMLDKFLRDDDYDGVMYVLSACLRRMQGSGTFLPGGTLRCVQSTHVLHMLLSFGRVSSETVRETVMFYAVCGRVDLLRSLCEGFELSDDILCCTIFELRHSVRGDYTLPSRYSNSPPESPLEYRFDQDAPLWDFLYSEHKRTYQGSYFHDGNVIRKKRNECLAYLRSYRDALELIYLRDA